MKTKMIEIRDEGTTIAALAIRMEAANQIEDQFLWREGYPRDGHGVVLLRLSDQGAQSDPYGWPSATRTMRAAHLYILEHWDELIDGSVVDARVQLGEADEHVAPEIWTGSLTGDFQRDTAFKRMADWMIRAVEVLSSPEVISTYAFLFAHGQEYQGPTLDIDAARKILTELGVAFYDMESPGREPTGA